MKYLKRFNESINISEEEFEEQCEVYITELEDLEVSVEVNILGSSIIELSIDGDGELFSWDYVKDVMIPFLEFLNSKYTIHDIVVNDEYLDEEEDELTELMGHDNREVTLEHIISDDFNSSEISYIIIKLK